jgi:ribosome-binding factor A
MSEYTKKRLESRIAEAVSMLILKGEIKNPGLSTFVSVSGVIISSDTAHAKVSITSFEDEGSLHRSVAALNSASGFIQGKLAKLLKSRNTPQLTFSADTSIRDGMNVNRLIDSLNNED